MNVIAGFSLLKSIYIDARFSLQDISNDVCCIYMSGGDVFKSQHLCWEYLWLATLALSV